MGISFIYRKLFLEACLVFNFWTFGAVLYLSFGQFLLNKSPNFYDFFSLLFKTVFYSKQSCIKEFTVIRSRVPFNVWIFVPIFQWLLLFWISIKTVWLLGLLKTTSFSVERDFRLRQPLVNIISNKHIVSTNCIVNYINYCPFFRYRIMAVSLNWNTQRY